MPDWIVEADIYRLRKAIADEYRADERRSLELLLEQKELQLARMRQGKGAATQEVMTRSTEPSTRRGGESGFALARPREVRPTETAADGAHQSTGLLVGGRNARLQRLHETHGHR